MTKRKTREQYRAVRAGVDADAQERCPAQAGKPQEEITELGLREPQQVVR